MHAPLQPIVMALLLTSSAIGAPVADGDYNGDGMVTAADATLLLAAAVGLRTPTVDEVARADLDGNGRLGVPDAQMLLRILVGLAPPLGARPLVPLPPLEVLAENQASKWGDVAGDSGRRTLYGVAGADVLYVAQWDTTPVRFGSVQVEGGLRAAGGELVRIEGELRREADGRVVITPTGAPILSAAPSLTAVLTPQLARAVAAVDLGPESYARYAEATSAVCRSSAWPSRVSEAFAVAHPRQAGLTPDGRLLVLEVRGPRLPPEVGIVFRYLRVVCVYDLATERLRRALVDVEGWVEE